MMPVHPYYGVIDVVNGHSKRSPLGKVKSSTLLSQKIFVKIDFPRSSDSR